MDCASISRCATCLAEATAARLRALDGVSFEVRARRDPRHRRRVGLRQVHARQDADGHPRRHSAAASCSRAATIAGLSTAAARARCAPNLQYCYQDPGASLDPRWTIRRSLARAADRAHQLSPEPSATQRVREILRAVGLPETASRPVPARDSGGQQRRVGLARILTLHPRLVMLDEPTSGLDVSVQATVLKLLRDLQRAFGAHLSVHLARPGRGAHDVRPRGGDVSRPHRRDRRRPRHVRSAAPPLYAVAAGGDPADRRSRASPIRFALEGEPPDPTRPPSGCRFRTRCPRAIPACAETDPPLRPVAPAQSAACLLA